MAGAIISNGRGKGPNKRSKACGAAPHLFGQLGHLRHLRDMTKRQIKVRHDLLRHFWGWGCGGGHRTLLWRSDILYVAGTGVWGCHGSTHPIVAMHAQVEERRQCVSYCSAK